MRTAGASIRRMSEGRPDEESRNYAAERPKAFVDAVVAIAMTLLILPLMESVGEASSSGEDTLEWLGGHRDQLLSFGLSFVIIAMFWMSHHRLFAHVHLVSNRLLWLLAAWMLSIVWLPVATAISGQMSGEDSLARVLYIGSMIVTALLSLVIRLYLRRNPELHTTPLSTLRDGTAVDLAMATLFGLSLLIAVLSPTIGYYSMVIMFAMGPLEALYAKLIGRAFSGSGS